ncbi:MAG: M14 family zinc carboxypeptidase [Planctomycetota bacterium]|jgi:hypothetical protein
MKTAQFAALLLSSMPLLAQAPSEENKYTEKIREYTTDECFLTPHVDHLPRSETVPDPMDFFGDIAGAPDVLHYSHEVHAYLRALAEASPRVKVIEAGTSEEGREMILVIVSSEDNLANLEKYKEINRRLADPRLLAEGEEKELIAKAKPMYWATGAMHSPETGSPEMLMELAYRLAVEERPYIQDIRENSFFMLTPVLDVDGRDKRVDLLKISQADEDAPVPSLLYWGKYVAHDNNRDSIGLGLELSKMLMRVFLEFHPQVLHDLHESANHLYTSTGTGPYNAWVDPILVDEWHTLAYQEITEMTKFGVPGVWTHNFYDGWAPNYGFYAANGHNAIGRFYETQGAGNANTRRITARNSSREWYRPNPPLPTTMWSIRNNVNLQQSGLIIAANYVATHREKYMENFFHKSQRSVAKAHTEGPAAYVFPADDPRPGMVADLLDLMQRQGCEIHKTVRDASVGEMDIPAGSYVLRMDQPYSRMADMLLDRGYYNINDPRPYDDTGWTLGPLYNVDVKRVEDEAILDVYMELVDEQVRAPGGVDSLTHGDTIGYLINATADAGLATFRFDHPELQVVAAESNFDHGGVAFNAGSFMLYTEDHEADLGELLGKAGEEHGFTAYAVSEMPEVRSHSVSVPRVAVMHTWTNTQNEGWMRMALDVRKIPYEYISVHEVRDDPKLREKYDVIVFGPSRGNAMGIINGLPMTGDPIPWKASEVAPNIGRQDETDDMRGGLELEGVMHLRDFIRDGGVFVTIQSSSALPIHFGLASGVSIADPQDLRASGSVLQAEFRDETSPIRYGYGDKMGVYFRQSPVFRMGGGGFGRRGFGRRGGGGGGNMNPEERLLSGAARPTGRGTVDDPDRVQGRPRGLGQPDESEEARAGRGGRGGRGGRAGRAARNGPRAILSFARDHKELLISGMLAGGDELAGTPAVVDAPLGEGHVVLFAINPMWRGSTSGSHSLLLNTILHFDNLDAGRRRSGRSRADAVGGGGGDR